MKEFWIWYDHKCDPALRFIIFSILAVICLLIVPFATYLAYKNMLMGQIVGLLIMAALALSKETRYPDWPKSKK
jgi:uncharacterized membrane protein